MSKNLEVKSKALLEANLSEKDLEIVMYSVKHWLIAELNDNRAKGCDGVVNGIFHALKSQGRDDLNKLIDIELREHSAFEMAN